MKLGRVFLRCFSVCMATILLVFAVGCGGGKPDAKPVAQSVKSDLSIFTIADTAGDWGFPSPFLHYQRGPGYIRMSLIFDTLIWKDEKAFVPALAERWEISGDGLTYRFMLRQNVKWHDGKPLTPEDVAFTFSYLKQQVYPWSSIAMVSRVETKGEREVLITLSKPYAPFLDNIAATIPILPKHIWQDVKDPRQYNKPEALIGTGPYRLADYNREQGSYRYAAFAGYYGGKPKISELRFVKMSPETAVAALRQKQVDLIQAPPDMVEKLKHH